ncbi:hypothetical protein BDP55DRAFT_666978 [Colletotrichum godetiae]|uniref:Uncharacterized protein n=1 Tax=Colletotrichum godetiae TaxID=1209918 RepID=A0AAJ0EWV5_9PEZI|nr:uncharacterized protein BDP55DRAFT_666978 [Colletotrichum godetiae]KAK1674604.1 hypothetical protein BDP55DRAFT_666978 [Colletotrichum godetiae]
MTCRGVEISERWSSGPLFFNLSSGRVALSVGIMTMAMGSAVVGDRRMPAKASRTERALIVA